MKQTVKLEAQTRDLKAKKAKVLRREGFIPATVYGRGVESVSVGLSREMVEEVFGKKGESGLVELTIDEKESFPILLRNPQYSVIKGDLIHIDCFKVDLNKKINAMVPIILTGESKSVRGGNILVEVSNEVEVEAKPTDLPEHFVVDISVLDDVEKTIIVADLEIDKEKVEILTPADQVIVKTEEPKEEEVIEEPVAEVAEGEGAEGEEDHQPEADKEADKDGPEAHKGAKADEKAENKKE